MWEERVLLLLNAEVVLNKSVRISGKWHYKLDMAGQERMQVDQMKGTLIWNAKPLLAEDDMWVLGHEERCFECKMYHKKTFYEF